MLILGLQDMYRKCPSMLILQLHKKITISQCKIMYVMQY